ncbi:MAG: DUF115 domain-containing protein [Bacteroidales bacterium]|nr:DUF115 domain-containing protein [Clostridium sp.]MCM1204378.1 DUF115 domain-containing protein [Bacteroidales bacterium]
MPVLEAVFADIGFYNQEMEIVNPEGISVALQSMMKAQETGDYVLLGDLLELQLIPFIQSLQEAIRAYEGVEVNTLAWDNNLAVLKQKNPELVKELEKYHQRYEQETAKGLWKGAHHLEMTNSGLWTMAGKDKQGVYYYHSNVNPTKEARAFAEYYYNIHQSSYLLWGLGLGYHIINLMALDEGIMMNVIESDLDVIYHFLRSRDMPDFLENPGFSLIYDPDFTKLFSLLKDSENLIIHHPSLRHIQNKEVREKLEQFFIQDSGMRNARILLESNSRDNFRHFDGYVDELREEFNGKDAVIVAAGPSLDRNVELLKNKKPGMIILAVETVFRKLLSMGIDVDYVIVTDANSRVYRHIEGLENQTVPILYLSTAYKGFAKNYKGKKYLICQKGYEKAEKRAEENGWNLYETGGSVSTTALDVCIRLGCRAIAFVGLDLAYTGSLGHAEETNREKNGVDVEDMQQVPAVGGGMVPTSRVFMIYNQWIAKRVKKEDVTMPVYDATEGGAIVPGLEITTLREFLDR